MPCPNQMRRDPGYEIFAHEFSQIVESSGYGFKRNMLPTDMPPFGGAIQWRFYKSKDEPFPILQIGPGIFACNFATEYDWTTFKEFASESLSFVYDSYPSMKSFDIKPTRFELRYVDVFDKGLLGHTDIVKFVTENTNLNLGLSDFLKSDQFFDEYRGNILISRRVKNKEDAAFDFNLGTGTSGDEVSIVMTSKVTKDSNFTDVGKEKKERVEIISAWLDTAHDILSPFFKGLNQR